MEGNYFKKGIIRVEFYYFFKKIRFTRLHLTLISKFNFRDLVFKSVSSCGWPIFTMRMSMPRLPLFLYIYMKPRWNRKERWNLSAFTIILLWRRKSKRERKREMSRSSLTGISAPSYICMTSFITTSFNLDLHHRDFNWARKKQLRVHFIIN